MSSEENVSGGGTGGEITISKGRLQQLEQLEKELPNIIQKSIEDHEKQKLEKLRERDKANPDKVNERAKRYYEKHKEEIKQKRKAKKQTTSNEA